MEQLYYLLGIGIVFYIVVEFIKTSNGARSAFSDLFLSQSKKNEYRKRVTLMNGSEAAFFHELMKQLPNNYYVFPKMRIADLVTAEDGEGYYSRFNRIIRKHIDFVVSDNTFTPALAIELNGSSHQRQDRANRDEFVKRVFSNANIPLEFVNVGSNFEQTVRDLLRKHEIVKLTATVLK